MQLKRFLRRWFFFALAVFVFMLLFAKETELVLFIAIGLVLGGAAAIGAELGLAKANNSGDNKRKQTNQTAPVATEPKPIYIRKPFENGFVYRIEWRHGKQYVFEGHSNKYIYRIEDNKVFRGTETKVYYQLKGNKVYRVFDYKDPVYRIEGDRIYQGNFGTKQVYTISRK